MPSWVRRAASRLPRSAPPWIRRIVFLDDDILGLLLMITGYAIGVSWHGLPHTTADILHLCAGMFGLASTTVFLRNTVSLIPEFARRIVGLPVLDQLAWAALPICSIGFTGLCAASAVTLLTVRIEANQDWIITGVLLIVSAILWSQRPILIKPPRPSVPEAPAE
jgi:hypothetical protein